MTRDELILSCAYQVKIYTSMGARKYHLHPEAVEDLEGCLWLALISAVDKFDPTRKVTMRTYIGHRLRGATLDFLRDIDPLTRAHRQRVRDGIDAPVSTTTLEDIHNNIGKDDPQAARLIQSDTLYKIIAATELTPAQRVTINMALHGECSKRLESTKHNAIQRLRRTARKMTSNRV